MTIDERLDRLTERHEALTQAVELIARSSEERLGKLEEMQEKNQILLAHVLESIDSLARIAHVHEQRLTNLDGGPN